MNKLSDFYSSLFDLEKSVLIEYGSNITLTTDNVSKVNVLIPTSSGIDVFLPDATTLTVGSYKFIFKNASSNISTRIVDSSGSLLYSIGVDGSISFHLQNNSTSAGTWAVTDKNNIS